MTRRALLLGVGDYSAESGLESLPCPESDVELLEEVFSDPKAGGTSDTVQSHANLSLTEAKRALFDFLKTLDRDDTALIHFSGHGVQDPGGDLYLCFADTKVDELEISALPIEQVRRMLDNRRARRVLITLDCCYSGIAGEQLTRSSTDAVHESLKSVETDFGQGHGVYVLSASGRSQTAKEDAKKGAGVFTWHLAEGIRTGSADLDGDGQITVAEIANYLQREVPKDATRQTPHLSAKNVSGTFVVAESRLQNVEAQIKRFSDTLDRLVDDRLVLYAFAGEVQDWLSADNPLPLTTDPKWSLLEDIADGKLIAADFQERWRNLDERIEPAPTPPKPEPAPWKPPEASRIPKHEPPKQDEPTPDKEPPPSVRMADAFSAAVRKGVLALLHLIFSPLMIFAASGYWMFWILEGASYYRTYDRYSGWREELVIITSIVLAVAGVWQVGRMFRRKHFRKTAALAILCAFGLAALGLLAYPDTVQFVLDFI